MSMARFVAMCAALIAAGQAPAAVRTGIGADGDVDPALFRVEEAQYLGTRIPDVSLRTPDGDRSLRAALHGAPGILVLGYFGCQGVCPTTLRMLAESLREVRRPHRVFVLSFDSRDRLETLAAARAQLEPAPADWTFGLMSPPDADRLTAALGYRYRFLERERVFAHPNVLVFVSGEGRVTRYLYGPAPRRRDVELALTESADGITRAGDAVAVLALVCFTFDPTRSRYVLHPLLAFGGAGLGVLAVAGFAALAWRPHSKGAHS